MANADGREIEADGNSSIINSLAETPRRPERKKKTRPGMFSCESQAISLKFTSQ